MRSEMFALVLALTLVPVAFAQGKKSDQSPTAPTADLAKPYATTLGDMIALTMNQYLPLIRLTDSPTYSKSTMPFVIAAYDHDEKMIGVLFFGGESSVD